MKIFISWSGKRSLGVATALRDWLPYLFSSINLFVSSEDIRKGKRWPLEVSKELDASNFGIVCLTPDNLEAPWLLFEAGALSKSIKEASVFTLLTGGLKNSDVQGPLSHFQHTLFEKDDFFKLVTAINNANTEAKQDDQRLGKIFDKFWGDLESEMTKANQPVSKPTKNRSVEEIVQELLETTNYIARNMPLSPTTNEFDANNKRPISKHIWQSVVERVIQLAPDSKDIFSQSSSASITAGGLLLMDIPYSLANEIEKPMPMLSNILTKVFAEFGLPPIRGYGFHFSNIKEGKHD